jgi:hypothetical protein
MSMQVRLPTNILVSKYVKPNSCLLAHTGTTAPVMVYSRCRPIAAHRNQFRILYPVSNVAVFPRVTHQTAARSPG